MCDRLRGMLIVLVYLVLWSIEKKVNMKVRRGISVFRNVIMLSCLSLGCPLKYREYHCESALKSKTGGCVDNTMHRAQH